MRQSTSTIVLTITAVGLSVLLGVAQSRPLQAQQTGGLPALEKRVAALEAQIATLAQSNADQAQEIAALKQRMVQVEEKLVYVSVQGSDMIIEGANLHIRNGLGATNGLPGNPGVVDPNQTVVNGLGNLIIGYNAESGFGSNRGGSHNLVLGDFNYYESFGGIVAGFDNWSQSAYASALGGRSNRVGGEYSSIVGGAFNVIDGHTASILGGNGNRASDIDSTVCGGNLNHANARFSVVGGGSNIVQGVEFGWSAGSFGPAVQGSFRSP